MIDHKIDIINFYYIGNIGILICINFYIKIYYFIMLNNLI